MPKVTEKKQQDWVKRFRETLALYRKMEDLINIGAYVKGTNPRTDQAIAMMDSLNRYLRQDSDTKVFWEQSLAALEKLFA